MSFVVFLNGALFIFMALFMALDAVLFPGTARIFATASLLSATLGLLLVIATWSAPRRLRRPHTFLLTALVWLISALAGALPLWLWGLTGVDAVFEAMSGITTTGSTVMSGLDTTEHGILFWRSLLNGLGGVGFVVTGIALLPFLRVGGMQLFRTESSDKGEKELGSITAVAAATLWVYLALIASCALVYSAGGMSTFDAITHAMPTIATGGFANYDASFGHFDSAFLHWSATLFMLLGTLPFTWYIRAIVKHRFRSEQIVALLQGLGFATLILTLWLVATTDMPVLTALRHVAFNVVSVVSTTGFASTDYNAWGPFAAAAFFLLTAIGGCTGSTAGGPKVMRWIVFLKAATMQIRAIHYPHAVQTLRYEGRPVERDVMSGVISYFTFFIASLALLTLSLGFVGLDPITASSGALTALTNVGPGVGAIIGPAGNFASLNDAAKVLLTFGMYLGRLELMTVFVLLTARYWRTV